ncbi:MAG: hypothetical protein CBC55_04895 [Gammaproteobacteria bacterium TMED95]|nr:serine protease [Alteromonas mediterranea]OUV22132.1 MAG: hypothetical protein CBC55_04895 [Gammaproteobacteria bacterium TMED95]
MILLIRCMIILSLSLCAKAYSNEPVYFRSGMEIVTDKEELAVRDNRELRHSLSPAYLNSVGQLKVIDELGNLNVCTAFPPAFKGNDGGILYFQTSAHCFLDFKTLEEKRVAHAEWSTFIDNWKLVKIKVDLVHLDKVNDIAVLKGHRVINDEALLPLRLSVSEVGGGVIEYHVAGYHGDMTKNGLRLAVDSSITRNSIRDANGKIIVDTVAFNGSSGGPLTYINSAGEPVVLGLIRGNAREDKQYLINGNMGSDMIEFIGAEKLNNALTALYK